jgi:hypothetical protein
MIVAQRRKLSIYLRELGVYFLKCDKAARGQRCTSHLRRVTAHMKKLTLLFGLASGFVFAAAFQNGGFESPVLITSPDFVTVPTGWVKFDPTANGLFMEGYSTFSLPTLGGQGTQAFGFGGNGAVLGDLSQTFDTVAGTQYHVGFQYVVQQGFEFEDLKVSALDGATVLASNAIRFNDRAWVTSVLNFTAASSSTTLRFSDTTGAVDPGFGFGTNWALDAVTVNAPDTPGVPEPSTLALAGLGLAAFLLRRANSRNS